MSEWRWGLDGEEARSVACPYCGAAGGQMCVTESGRVASNYHGERFAANPGEADPICRHCRRYQSEHAGPDNDVCPRGLAVAYLDAPRRWARLRQGFSPKARQSASHLDSLVVSRCSED